VYEKRLGRVRHHAPRITHHYYLASFNRVKYLTSISLHFFLFLRKGHTLYDSFPPVHRQLSLGIAFFIGAVSARNFAGLLAHRDRPVILPAPPLCYRGAAAGRFLWGNYRRGVSRGDAETRRKKINEE
jgi:hypothetical protein